MKSDFEIAPYGGLPKAEAIEFKQLKDKLFGNEMFVVFTDEQIASDDYKRYEELLKVRMRYLRLLHNSSTSKFLRIVNF